MGKNRSKDFRYVFANAFGLRFSDNDATLTLGIHEGGDPEGMLEEVAVVMTPRTLKIMANNINNVIERFESEVGEISIPPGKLAPIQSGKANLSTGEGTTEKPKK